uniref:uncharacterized protein LOC122597245 n=1 Tax=Erigeron canadensis TaxID=72917 RepID=UPI001CB9B0DA|nr:uncharacterized protein LOC122597245 [Erigeron canadensis]
MRETPIEFPIPLFSCVELKLLTLHNCCFPARSKYSGTFHGFPNLLILDFTEVILEGREYGEFIASCPLLHALIKLNTNTTPTGKVKPVEIAKLENLQALGLALCEVYDDVAITSLDFFQLIDSFPKLEYLSLDLQNCKFKVVNEVSARSRFSSALRRLKVLGLRNIDLQNRATLFFFFHLIRDLPNVDELRIMLTDVDRVSLSPFTSDEIVTFNLQQLQLVTLDGIQDSDIEISLIYNLLEHCPLLKEMIITTSPKTVDRSLELAATLLVAKA